MNQKQEQQRIAAVEAMKQARESVHKAVGAGVRWYVTRARQERERLDLPREPEVHLDFVLREDPEWQRVEAKREALDRLFEAAENAAAVWL